ncbi:MAG: glycosyltransferase family 9 protein [Lishizhenia sp.]
MSKEINVENKTVVISRTDSIGDVLLTLPMVSWLKESFAGVKVIFLGKSYTKDIVNCHAGVDEFLDWDTIEALPVQQRVNLFKEKNIDVFVHVFPNKKIAQLAKKAKIQYRIGTSHRSFHFLTCNIRPTFTRRKSNQHEAQLNFNLLRSFGIEKLPTLAHLIRYNNDFNKIEKPTEALLALLNVDTDKPKIILHAKSQGSALEWGLENFSKLAQELSQKGYTVFYTGTEKEGEQIRNSIPPAASVYDVTGKMSLSQLVRFIASCDGLVACSTGPLHIAASLNKIAVGLYSPKRPIHPGRWQPLGEKATALVYDANCTTCASGKKCECIKEISVETVLQKISQARTI